MSAFTQDFDDGISFYNRQGYYGYNGIRLKRKNFFFFFLFVN